MLYHTQLQLYMRDITPLYIVNRRARKLNTHIYVEVTNNLQ